MPKPWGPTTIANHAGKHFNPTRAVSLGITDGLLRFSVGIEDQPDLIADLEQGFQAAAEAR
jgi:cystathionine beta-lyase/cystathionine gamma-synthase